jgi:hypothetical protein
LACWQPVRTKSWPKQAANFSDLLHSHRYPAGKTSRTRADVPSRRQKCRWIGRWVWRKAGEGVHRHLDWSECLEYAVLV